MTDMAHGIARDAIAAIDAGTVHRTTWGAFLTDNADAIEAGDVAPEILARDLLRRPGCTAFGGGGASAEWSVRLIVEG